MIEQFKSSFQDVARLNRFRIECVRFPSDAILLSATLAGESWNTDNERDPDHLGAIPYALPVDIIQNDVALTFIVDDDYKIKKALDTWWLQIFDSSKGGGFGWHNEYVEDIKIIGLDRQGNDRYQVTIVQAYPAQYTDIIYDMSLDAGFIPLTITFKYGDIVRG
jgi:hypothetical protein